MGAKQNDLLIYPVIILFVPLLVLNLIPIGEQQFVALSQSILQGKLNVTSDSSSFADYASYKGYYYWPLGPFPAIALLPFVAIMGTNFYQGLLQLPLSIINFFLVYNICLVLQLESKKSFWAAVFFIFGSVYTPVAAISFSWYLAQIVATTLLLSALYSFLVNKSWLLTGILMGLAVATRSSLVLGAFFFLFYIFRNKDTAKNLLLFAAPIAVGVVLLAMYNFVRFDTILESGYNYQNIPEIVRATRDYGLFSPKHIPANLYYMLLKTPDPIFLENSHVLQFPYIKYDPFGISVFVLSPILFLLAKTRLKEKYVAPAIATSVLIAIPIITYCGIGYIQVGYRYALDFFPFLLIPLASAIRYSNMKVVIALTSLGILSTWFLLIGRIAGI